MGWRTEVNSSEGYAELASVPTYTTRHEYKIGDGIGVVNTASVNIFGNYYPDTKFLGRFSFYDPNNEESKAFFAHKMSTGATLNIAPYAHIEAPDTSHKYTILSYKLNNCHVVFLANQSSSDIVYIDVYHVKKLLNVYPNNYFSDEKNAYFDQSAPLSVSGGGIERNHSVLAIDSEIEDGENAGVIFHGFCVITEFIDASTLEKSYGTTKASFFTDSNDIFGDFTDKRSVSDDFGEESSAGGYGGGSFDDSSDAFGLPSLPALGVSEVGFINVYNPSKGQLQGFADELFPDFELPEPSTKEGLEAIADNLAKTFSVLGDFAESYINAGLVNYVIDCHIVPVKPSAKVSNGIKVGFKTFNYNPSKVISDYVEFNCGSLEIAEYYQNFLDYEGTRAKLYLPFVGFVDIKPEWFQSGKLGVTYHFNVIDGSCIAFVIATSSKSKLRETVVATFGGNCCVHMPITGVNYASMISGVVGGIAGVASAGARVVSSNQNDKATLGSNVEGVCSVASNFAGALGSRPTLEQSNGYNAGMSFMCYRRPYLLIERPVASFSKNYPSEQGLPLNVTKKLSSVTGFTTCDNVNLDDINCTEEEKNMIREALQVGCIF